MLSNIPSTLTGHSEPVGSLSLADSSIILNEPAHVMMTPRHVEPRHVTAP